MPDRVRKKPDKDQIVLIPCNTWERLKDKISVIHGKRKTDTRVLHGLNEFMGSVLHEGRFYRVLHGKT